MDFFKQNPGIVGQVVRIIFEFLGFIKPSENPDEDGPARQYAEAIMASAGRLALLGLVFLVEFKVARFFGL